MPITITQKDVKLEVSVFSEKPTKSSSRLLHLSPSFNPNLFAQALLPVAFFFVATVIMTFPLILNFDQHIILGAGVDATQNMWDFWWFKTALFDRHTNPFYTDMLYFPYRQGLNSLPLFFHTLQPLNMVLVLPIMLLVNSPLAVVISYNSLIFFSLVASGCTMFWLVRYLGANYMGAILAGILFTFGPYHQYTLQKGQTNLLSTEWLPLYILFLHRLLYLKANLKRRRDTLLAVTFLVATTFTDWTLTLYLLLATGLLVLVCLVEYRKMWASLLLRVGIMLGLWVLIVSPFLVATMLASTDPSFSLVSGIDYEVLYSLKPADFLSITKDSRVVPAVWALGTLGFVAISLGSLGLVRLRRKALGWLLLIVVGLILALGPYLKLNNAVSVASTTGVPLPYLFLRQLPFVSITRVPERYILLAYFGLAVLAGFGMTYLLDKIKRGVGQLHLPQPKLAFLASGFSNLSKRRGVLLRGSLSCLLLSSTLLELATLPQPLKTMASSPFFAQLGAEPGDFAILELPITTHYIIDSARMFYQTIHGKTIFGGYLSRPVEDYYNEATSPFHQFFDLNATLLQNDIVAPLQASQILDYYHIKYVIIYKNGPQNSADNNPAVTHTSSYLQKVLGASASLAYEDAQLMAFRIAALPSGQTTRLVWADASSWYAPETTSNGNNTQTHRWSSGKSNLYINTQGKLRVQLSFQASSFQANTPLTVSVNGQPLQSFELTTTPKQYTISTVLELGAGQDMLTFSSTTPPISPAALGLSKNDTRKLSFAISNVTLSDD
jgi:hypothetical protein